MQENIIKATLRIPTKHQYAYIEVQVEGTPEQIAKKYILMTDTYMKEQKAWDEQKPPF